MKDKHRFFTSTQASISFFLLNVSIPLCYSFLPYPLTRSTILPVKKHSFNTCAFTIYPGSILTEIKCSKSKTLLKSSNDGISEEEQRIQNAYKAAMEEDEEWYNEFVANILQSQPSTPSSTKSSMTQTLKEDEENDELDIAESNFLSMEEKSNAGDTTILELSTENKGEEDKYKTNDEIPTMESKDDELYTIPPMEEADQDEFVDSLVITESQLNQLQELGYSLEECQALAMDAMDIILQDSIQRPSSGIPPRWKSGNEIVHEDLVDDDTYDDEDDEDELEEDENEIPSVNYSSAKYTNSKRSPPQPERRNRRRTRAPKRQSIAYENDSEFENKFWPSQSTFQNYLRREAQLRLAILGPSWKDLVKSESEWRLDLYKEWLRVLEDGLGDDVITSGREGGDMRRRRPARRRKRRRDLDEENYPEYDDYEARRRRRNMRKNGIRERARVDSSSRRRPGDRTAYNVDDESEQDEFNSVNMSEEEREMRQKKKEFRARKRNAMNTKSEPRRDQDKF